VYDRGISLYAAAFSNCTVQIVECAALAGVPVLVLSLEEVVNGLYGVQSLYGLDTIEADVDQCPKGKQLLFAAGGGWLSAAGYTECHQAKC
jgi:hypothetical protein